MKISLLILNKKSNVTILGKNSATDAALMGTALILEAAKKISKDKNISIKAAKEILTSTIMES
mgnify:CR=1 FL=1